MNNEMRKNIRRLMSLLSKDELAEVLYAIGAPRGADSEQIIGILMKLPRYQLVRLFILAAGPTLKILQDIFSTLEVFKIAVRTTGCIFILANPTSSEESTEVAFSQQSISVISEWSSFRDWHNEVRPIEDLNSNWISFQPIWRKLLSKARPDIRRGKIDIVRSVINDRPVYGPKSDYSDERAQLVLKYLLDKVSKIVEKFKNVPLQSRPTPLKLIIRDMDELLYAGKPIISPPKFRASRRRRLDKETPSDMLIRQYTSDRFLHDFDKFLEDAMLLGDLIQGEDLLDLLRLDIWSSRPQLYEIWILLSILRWLSQRGYEIELSKIQKQYTDAPFRWNLSYARDSEPCAIVKTLEQKQFFLFYQLYRKSGDMPDISLLDGPTVESDVIWSIDPKHSEAGGYSSHDYKSTAKRYRESFGAELSIVVEYFDRSDLDLQNPTYWGNGALIIHNCNPNGSGLHLLLKELGKIHPVLGNIILCIDFSESFSSQRERVLSNLRKILIKENERYKLINDFVCFAGNAVCAQGVREWLHGENEVFSSLELSPGTRSEPLLKEIEKLVNKHTIIKAILVTDGEFDINLQTVMERMESSFQIEIDVYPRDFRS